MVELIFPIATCCCSEDVLEKPRQTHPYRAKRKAGLRELLERKRDKRGCYAYAYVCVCVYVWGWDVVSNRDWHWAKKGCVVKCFVPLLVLLLIPLLP